MTLDLWKPDDLPTEEEIDRLVNKLDTTKSPTETRKVAGPWKPDDLPTEEEIDQLVDKLGAGLCRHCHGKLIRNRTDYCGRQCEKLAAFAALPLKRPF